MRNSVISKIAWLAVMVMAAVLIGSSPVKADKITPRLEAAVAEDDGDGILKVWVYFKDKDTAPSAFAKATANLSQRSSARRVEIPLDWYDLPVKDEYVRAIHDLGGKNVRPSRWLNAVSASLTAAQIDLVAGLDFVKSVDLVVTLRRPAEPPLPAGSAPPPADSTEYGPSLVPLKMLGIDSLHRVGIINGTDTIALAGHGVLIAFLDTGYKPDHPSLDSAQVVDTWDYINDDASVNDQLPVADQLDHGTVVWSVCGGWAPDSLIGAAYGADFALYKTENYVTETEVEEDNWVLASERADSVGADIISSSLGYDDWYSYGDMDGNTAVTTIAADIAASRGIMVVVSAGNEGSSSWHYIGAPADGDSVVAVGAVTSDGLIASFSSFGPTCDGRVKPEVVAMGSGVWSANYHGGYFLRSGTSLACPLIAGSAALILQANPVLRGHPMDVRHRLIASADRFPTPDPNHQYGYGLPDIIVAAGFGLKIHPLDEITILPGRQAIDTITTLAPIGATVVFDPIDFPDNFDFIDLGDGQAELVITGDLSQMGRREYQLAAGAGDFIDTILITVITLAAETPFYVGPNPFTDTVTLNFTDEFPSGYTLEIFNLAGESVFEHSGSENRFTWKGVNSRGEKVASGLYIIHFSADGIDERVKIFKL